MCDYSIQAKRQAQADVGQTLVTTKFGESMSTGFMVKGGDPDTAICLLPGTELTFGEDVIIDQDKANVGKLARFRQTNKDTPSAHHDQLEFANGRLYPLGYLPVGLEAVVLQLPAAPKNAAEAAQQKRAAYAG